ncbi:hypothetical protein [Methylopila sp. M107]|uniref:hypothetical protein n=1 Tax=Methylopila sp. M107 TaxID=1101190 RepID=UPI00037554F3|nr:hypothetical protein [Methylopila sp. M107]
MANIVSHVVTVAGSPEAVRRFRNRMITGPVDAGSPSFDFAALVPMPSCLEHTLASSFASDGLIILGEFDLPDPLASLRTVGQQADLMLAYPWVREARATDRAGLADLLKRRARADGDLQQRLDLARASIAAFRETGHVTSGSWANENWGCDGVRGFALVEDEPERLRFELGTAWASPDSIWSRIAEAFPDVTVDVVGFEEAWHFAVTGEIAGGRNGVVAVDADPALYERVYGEPFQDEEEGGPAPSPAISASAAPPAAPPADRYRTLERLAERVNWDLVGLLLAAIVVAAYVAWS